MTETASSHAPLQAVRCPILRQAESSNSSVTPGSHLTIARVEEFAVHLDPVSVYVARHADGTLPQSFDRVERLEALRRRYHRIAEHRLPLTVPEHQLVCAFTPCLANTCRTLAPLRVIGSGETRWAYSTASATPRRLSKASATYVVMPRGACSAGPI